MDVTPETAKEYPMSLKDHNKDNERNGNGKVDENNNNNNNNNTSSNSSSSSSSSSHYSEVEMLKRELEKERQSKMALENMIIVSSLNMIGKIEVLEKKHESQIEHLREQIQHYAEKEHENTSVIKSLEDMNAKLRKQVLELEKKQQKDGKETKRKRNVKVDDEKDEKKDAWDGTSSTGKMKRSKSDSSTEKKSKSGKAAFADSDPLREMVAEALGTFGDIEKRPPPRTLQGSAEGVRRSDSGGSNKSDWEDSLPNTPPPSNLKRRKTETLDISQDGSASPPHYSQSSSEYTSNYSTFFHSASSSSAYPASPSSAPGSPHHQNGQKLSASQTGSYALSSSRDGNRSPDDFDSPSSKRALAPLFPPSSILLPNSPHEKLLGDVHQYQIAQKERLEKMQQTQKQLIMERKHEPLLVGALESEQLQLRQQIDAEVKAIKQLDKQVVLEPNQLFRLDFLLQDLKIQQKQLELFHNELQSFISVPDPSRCHAALVITKQPFPMVISKFKQLQEEQLVVQLLSGSNVDFHSFSVVKAELICHTKAITKGSTSASNPNASLKKHVDRDTQPLDLSKGVAKFPLKFLTGTRKSCVTLRFVVQVKTASNAVTTIESNASQPFIVITNDCQWEGSEGTLLKNEAFSDQIEIAWPQFVNILQRHFLKATRQSPIQPTRPLSLYDFNYLNTKFFANKPIVSHKSFDNFWGWFGKSLQTVRYKRHISTLWQNGLIFMFLTRDRVTHILRNQDPGCFIILFSEAYPGQLEISYVASADMSASKAGLSMSSQGLNTSQTGLNGSATGINLNSSNQGFPTTPTSSLHNASFDSMHESPAKQQHTPIEPTPTVPRNPLAASTDGLNTNRNLPSNENSKHIDKDNTNPASPDSAHHSVNTSNTNGSLSLSTSGTNIPTTPSSQVATPTTPSTPSNALAMSTPLAAQMTVQGNKIKHYLVQANDTAGSKRTLPDFLNECPQFTRILHLYPKQKKSVTAEDILQLNVGTLNTSTDWATVGLPSFKKQPKDQVLEPFYSKRGNTGDGFIANGYDPLCISTYSFSHQS